MATQIRHKTDRLATNAQLAALQPLADPSGFWRALEEAPYAFDLFFAMRWIDAKQTHGPRLGYAARPSDEPIRIEQQPSLIFAPSMLSHARAATQTRPPVISQYAFGLFGPGGPLPLHLTELAHERAVTANDKTLSSFLNLFHHRASLMFYRAWADTQSTVSLDRPDKDNFSRFVSSIAGYGLPNQAQRDDVPDHAKRHVTGHLTRSVRTPESLQRMLEIAFGFPVQVKEWSLAWLALPPSQQTRLGQPVESSQLGAGAVAGSKVPDRQHCFGLRLGPMSLRQYEKLLPVGDSFKSLIDWVRNFSGFEFAWSAQLVLHRAEVPAIALGGTARLGWTSWIGASREHGDADEFVIQPENYVGGPGCVRSD